LIHELKSSVSKNICQSVIEITFVGIYAETSESIVSTIGSAVKLHQPKSEFNLEALSSNLECK